jgi:DHA1 family multidrug resistance protein-like MFS transporter
LLWGVQVVATILAKPIMGTISDRYGRQPLIFWGMFACALPLALIPWSRSYPVLLALAAVFGLGEAVVTSSAAALVADFCQREHLGAAMGTFGTIFDVGHAAGPLLTGVLISLWGGQDYRGPFAIIAALLIISALAFWKMVPRQEETAT